MKNPLREKLTAGQKEMEERWERIAKAGRALLGELGIADQGPTQPASHVEVRVEDQLKELRGRKEAKARKEQETALASKR